MPSPNNSLSYQDSGVSIDEGNSFVEKIKPHIKKTLRPEVQSSIGGFAALFELDLKKYKKPLLVSSTDGIGTKLKIGLEMKSYKSLGQDLVAMCVNDLICCGAEPLFFLDYLATSKLDTHQASELIEGVCDALASINCALLGGETAEMPGFYQKGDFDAAGFSVGAVEKSKVINGTLVKEDDIIIGLTSDGFHSNGFSLVRKVLEKNKISLNDDLLGDGVAIGKHLLKATKLYVNPILKALEKISIHALAHITGGGLIENIPRVFPKGFCAEIKKDQIKIPAIFKKFQELGPIEEEEMWRVFNMGVGFIVIIDPQDKEMALDIFNKHNQEAYEIGQIIKHNSKGVQFV